MRQLIICFSLIAFFHATGFAQDLNPDSVHNKQFYLSGGFHTEFYNQVQVDSKGNLRKFDTLPTIGVGIKAPLQSAYNFIGEVNWVLPQKTTDQIMKNLIMIRGDIAYSPIDWFRLRVGTSIMWMNQHVSGGSTTENNGNGSSKFYYPRENRSSINNTLDLGAEFLWDEWAFRFQTYTYSVFKEERRQLSYTIFVSYYWDVE